MYLQRYKKEKKNQTKKKEKKAQTAKGIEEQMQISWAATFGVCECVHANKWQGYTFLYTWLENDKKTKKQKKQDNCWTGHLPIKPKSKCVIEKKEKEKTQQKKTNLMWFKMSGFGNVK